jgi:hypothetical protein
MRKEERLLPPPDISDDADEAEALSKFMVLVMLGGILGVLLSSALYATAAYSVITILESADALSWNLSWFQCFFISIIVQFVRTWDRAARG